MELHLQRISDHEEGTNGELRLDGFLLCYTIELPWRGNRKKISCIPPGRYSLEERDTPLRGKHLLVEHVPGRTWILLHPANNALEELQGCIAPVSHLTGPGRGALSKPAFITVRDLVYGAIRRGQRVWLNIHSFKKQIQS